jgi:hypothetical protein
LLLFPDGLQVFLTFGSACELAVAKSMALLRQTIMSAASEWHAIYVTKIDTYIVRFLRLSAFPYLYDLTAITKSNVQWQATAATVSYEIQRGESTYGMNDQRIGAQFSARHRFTASTWILPLPSSPIQCILRRSSSTVLRVVTSCNFGRARRFGGTYYTILQPSMLPTSAGFLHDSLFDPEYGGDVFLRNVGFCPNYTALQLRGPLSPCSPSWEA